MFELPSHTVAQAFYTAGDATIHLNSAPPPATRPVASPPRTRAEALPAIEREFACNLRDLHRHYIIPNLQEFNPPDEANSPGLIASRQPAFGVVDDFLARPGLETVGHRCLFILGDAGMGKTSLLLMLAHRHFQALPAGRQCVLMKLGPDTLDRVAAVPDPGSTVLLLDSLDEDPAALDHAQGAEGPPSSPKPAKPPGPWNPSASGPCCCCALMISSAMTTAGAWISATAMPFITGWWTSG